MKTRVPIVVVICLVVAGFIWGVLQIFDMRFTRGDIYPAYSSLRADPLGTRIFYESLQRLEHLDVVRSENGNDQFGLPATATFFYLGTRGLVLTEKELIDVEKFIKRGGRLVLTFYPAAASRASVDHSTPTPSPSLSASPSPSPRTDKEEEESVKFFFFDDIQKRWEFHLTTAEKFEVAAATAKVPDIDAAVPWHSAGSFEKLGAVWRPIYTIGDRPVVIERSLGQGKIVLATDSYFLSNEAMRRDRRPLFLAWLVGDKARVIFDEVHHGVSEMAGVSTLIRRYRLGGFVLAALVIAILVCWKNVVRLVPTSAIETGDDSVVSGKESFAGLTSLFRRNIPPSELAEVCYSEWHKSLPRASRSVQLTADRVRTAMDNLRKETRSHRNPVEIYQEISRIIGEKKWKRSN